MPISNRKNSLLGQFIFLGHLFLATLVFTGTFQEEVKLTRDMKFKLHSGDYMPMIGFGTYEIRGTQLIKDVLDRALAAGYRAIDSAALYGNEEDIGKALKSFCQNIGYIDLYLIHWPGVYGVNASKTDNSRKRDQSWQQLVKGVKNGLTRNIGVSNYNVRHLKELLANDHGIKPAVNQVEWHPHYHQSELLDLCKKEGILLEAYSSLGGSDNKDLVDNPKVKDIAQKLGKSPAQKQSRSTDSEDCDYEVPAKKMKIKDGDIFRTGAKCLSMDEKQDLKLKGYGYHVLGAVRTKPEVIQHHLFHAAISWQNGAIWEYRGNSVLAPRKTDLFVQFHSDCQYTFLQRSPRKSDFWTVKQCQIKSSLVQNRIYIGQSDHQFEFSKDSTKQPCPTSISWCKIESNSVEVAVEGKRQGVTKRI
ncbi:hypothetical protein NQ318_010395 [Aromia moschata]|uniref:NADP-dependent oxidoreductase domain-containing protein n=1 Tax=Aromia moschata TaxID=1265417 RepID=A0AAV8Y565_9CUCU|nr:hypothetical protein NQ318_010395 [Aromia moschata]